MPTCNRCAPAARTSTIFFPIKQKLWFARLRSKQKRMRRGPRKMQFTMPTVVHNNTTALQNAQACRITETKQFPESSAIVSTIAVLRTLQLPHLVQLW